MSFYRRRLFLSWFVFGSSFIFPVLICIAIFVRWPELSGPILAVAIGFVVYCAAIVTIVAKANRVGEAARRVAAPGSVVFGAFNHPGALVRVGAYVLPDAPLARSFSFVVLVDGAGLSYLTPGKLPTPFVRVPWSDIESVSEVGGELAVALVSGDAQYIVPGARIPVGVNRVRALAASISTLQRERQL